MDDIKKVIENEMVGLFEAPTGLGKTDASISAALELAIKKKKKIFFITPKNSQHKIVVDTIKGINEKHKKKIRVIDFVAKPNLCTDPFIFGGGSEFYELCEKKVSKKACIGYQNTVGFRKSEKLKAENNVELFKYNNFALTNDEMRESCMEGVMHCPYEMSLLLAKDADVIIADVNHVFLESIRQRFFTKMEIELDDVIFIFDEAHNLPSRIRNIMSNSINQKTIEGAIKELQKVDEKVLSVNIKDFMQEFYEKFLLIENGFVKYNYFDMLFATYNFDDIMKSMQKASRFTIEEYETKSFLKGILSFMESWFFSGKTSTRFLDPKDNLQVKSLDPSPLSKNVINEAYASILMSATLNPFEMYETLLGVDKAVFKKRYESPFDHANKLVLYSDELTTKFAERKENIPKIANTILETINSISGNIAVFFPSYRMLDHVRSLVEGKTQKRLFVQQQKHTPLQGKRLIREFKKMQTTIGGVLFAVVGGSFSEGVDYPGDDLIGIIVVGLPFPEPDNEIKALIEYYDTLYSSGWDYAYVFPTISKIVQASGRAIRTETDRAFIMLLDKRYAWSKYKNLFPKDYVFQKYKIDKITKFMKQ